MRLKVVGIPVTVATDHKWKTWRHRKPVVNFGLRCLLQVQRMTGIPIITADEASAVTLAR